MKTLVISVDYPLPEDKGNRMRTMHFVRAFLRYGDVDLMCYESHKPSYKIMSPFRKEHYISFNDKAMSCKRSFLRRNIDRFIECKPWIVENFNDNIVKKITDTIVEEDYDIILCRYSVNAFPLLSLPEKYKKRVILDIDDLMSDDLYDVMNGEKKGVSRIKSAIDKIIFHRYQIKCLGLGNVCFCSEADRIFMASHSSATNLHVVPNIIPQQNIPVTYQRDGFSNNCLLFVGALSYPPNEKGILWFIRDIFEKLPEKYNDMKLLIVGKDPQLELKQIISHNPKIELVENPPDVVPYFERCSIVLVPLLVGGGTRIKILEAGNCSRPVITTPLGAYGLGLKDYDSVLYFDSHISFIEKLSWLDKNNNYNIITKRLSNIVHSEYVEEVFTDSIARILNSLND